MVKLDVLFQGFPGRMSRGYMSWSSVIYVEHRDTKLLFDTGSAVERSELPKRLKDRGVDVSQIDYVVLSHFHYDHALNIDYFKKARILLHEKEAEWVKRDPDDWPMPKFLYPVLEKSNQLELIKGEPEILPGMKLILTPGHTPGCMSLVLDDQDAPVTVLAGDAVKNIAELATGEVAMSYDNTASAQSIKRIREIAEFVVPGHDRMLKVQDDRIMAVSACHETITIPKGVCQDTPRTLELIVEQNQLLKQ